MELVSDIMQQDFRGKELRYATAFNVAIPVPLARYMNFDIVGASHQLTQSGVCEEVPGLHKGIHHFVLMSALRPQNDPIMSLFPHNTRETVGKLSAAVEAIETVQTLSDLAEEQNIDPFEQNYLITPQGISFKRTPFRTVGKLIQSDALVVPGKITGTEEDDIVTLPFRFSADYLQAVIGNGMLLPQVTREFAKFLLESRDWLASSRHRRAMFDEYFANIYHQIHLPPKIQLLTILFSKIDDRKYDTHSFGNVFQKIAKQVHDLDGGMIFDLIELIKYYDQVIPGDIRRDTTWHTKFDQYKKEYGQFQISKLIKELNDEMKAMYNRGGVERHLVEAVNLMRESDKNKGKISGRGHGFAGVIDAHSPEGILIKNYPISEIYIRDSAERYPELLFEFLGKDYNEGGIRFFNSVMRGLPANDVQMRIFHPIPQSVRVFTPAPGIWGLDIRIQNPHVDLGDDDVIGAEGLKAQKDFVDSLKKWQVV